MKIEKAIEILTSYITAEEAVETAELEDAVKLGIEGLKRLSQYRGWQPPSDIQLLPGETKD